MNEQTNYRRQARLYFIRTKLGRHIISKEVNINIINRDVCQAQDDNLETDIELLKIL